MNWLVLSPERAIYFTFASALSVIRGRRSFHLALLFVLAFFFTLLNALKPMHIDDAAGFYHAAQVAKQPLNPYGFDMFWYQHPKPAYEEPFPPVLPYWWALAIWLFGEQPFLWKLWLLPFSLLFVFACDELFRRFARGLEEPLLIMTVLSPTFLPSLNLMPHIPSVTLSLCALIVFLSASDRSSPLLAVLAGLVAGLAIETKYSGFLAPGILLLYALFFRKIHLWLLSAVVTGLVFVSWETFVTLLYKSYFPLYHLYHLHSGHEGLLHKTRLILPLLTILGGVAPAGALLGLTALRLSRWVVLTSSLFVLLGYVLLACVEVTFTAKFSFSPSLFSILEVSTSQLGLNHVIFSLFGLALCGSMAAVVWQLCRLSRGGLWRPALWRTYRTEWFLVLWLVLEVAGYFALTPFPAARRVMGIVIVFTVLGGRLASRTCRSPARIALVRAVAFVSMVVGLGFWAVDVRDAYAEKEAAEVAARYVYQQETAATVWYVGHWGFQYYAERAGMKPVVPDRSQLRRGNWLVVPDRVDQQRIRIDQKRTDLVVQLTVNDFLPLRTVPCYYSGRTPLEHHEGPRVVVSIYRVTADFVPATPEP
jgi:hypothetical protein